MDINGSIALVTGANRGLGAAFARTLLERGARTVYATARRPESIDIDGVERLALDVTDLSQVQRAAEVAGDVTLVINNAGISTQQPLIGGDLNLIRHELDTNLFGTVAVTQAFAPALARAAGGGAVLNVLSAMSWFAYPGSAAYHVAKAAAWAATNAMRLELAAQGTQVVGLHLGLADTDMAAGIPGDKADPAAVANAALDGIESGAWEVVFDDWSRSVKASLAADPRDFYEAMFGAATVQS